ncbi:MAG: YceI family protein [Dokdonella sp.]
MALIAPRHVNAWHALSFCACMMLSAMAVSASEYSEVAVLDTVHSHAEFSVRLLWMVDIEGEFGNVHGNVRIDRATGQAIVDARIDANAVRMRRPGTENWVKSDEFFHVARYPEMRFLSAPFPLSRLSEGGSLPGSLSLRGYRGDIVFTVRPATCARPAFDCDVVAAGSIRRSVFGMRSRKGTLSDKVELDLSIRVIEASNDKAAP